MVLPTYGDGCPDEEPEAALRICAEQTIAILQKAATEHTQFSTTPRTANGEKLRFRSRPGQVPREFEWVIEHLTQNRSEI